METCYRMAAQTSGQTNLQGPMYKSFFKGLNESQRRNHILQKHSVISGNTKTRTMSKTITGRSMHISNIWMKVKLSRMWSKMRKGRDLQEGCSPQEVPAHKGDTQGWTRLIAMRTYTGPLWWKLKLKKSSLLTTFLVHWHSTEKL